MVPTPRFAINGQVDTAPLALSCSGGLCKKPANDLFHLVRLHAMSQNPAPRTVMRHALAFEMEELAQFMGAEFGPMSHSTASILPGSFRQHPDHEQARQPIADPSSITMIRDGLQAGIERI